VYRVAGSVGASRFGSHYLLNGLLTICPNYTKGWLHDHEWHLESKVIKSHQKSLKVIKSHQKSLKVIKSHQKPSKVVKSHLDQKMLHGGVNGAELIKMSWKVIQSHPKSSKVIQSHPKSSKIIKSHQKSSRPKNAPWRCQWGWIDKNVIFLRILFKLCWTITLARIELLKKFKKPKPSILPGLNF